VRTSGCEDIFYTICTTLMHTIYNTNDPGEDHLTTQTSLDNIGQQEIIAMRNCHIENITCARVERERCERNTEYVNIGH
jgi:hypothetical protein